MKKNQKRPQPSTFDQKPHDLRKYALPPELANLTATQLAQVDDWFARHFQCDFASVVQEQGQEGARS